jgi:HEAT repeat protein
VMIRSAAVESLGKIQDRTAIVPLIQLLRDKESFVRARAAAALGPIKDSQAVAPLISVLAHDEAGEVRREAARSLGLIGGTDARRALEAALSDKDLFVRQYSWEALHPDQPM